MFTRKVISFLMFCIFVCVIVTMFIPQLESKHNIESLNITGFEALFGKKIDIPLIDKEYQMIEFSFTILLLYLLIISCLILSIFSIRQYKSNFLRVFIAALAIFTGVLFFILFKKGINFTIEELFELELDNEFSYGVGFYISSIGSIISGLLSFASIYVSSKKKR